MAYADKIHFEMNDYKTMLIWLEGENLEDTHSFSVSFRKINGKHVGFLGFDNLSDGVDFESLTEISDVVKKYEDHLNNLPQFHFTD
jgi:hypothetical protein